MSDHSQEQNSDDMLMSDQLKDQFVGWFVIVLAGYYLLDYLAQRRKS